MNRNAFTLIEILIATFIFSIILSIVAFSFRFSIEVIKFLKTPYLEEIQNISKVRDSINSIFFFLSEEEITEDLDKKFRFFFNGASKELTFISTNPILHKRDGLYIMQIKANNNNLVLKEYPVYDSLVDYKQPKIPSEVQPVVLLREIKDLKIEYFKTGTWHSKLKNQIPRLVKFTYSDRNSNKKILMFKIQSDFYTKGELINYLYSEY